MLGTSRISAWLRTDLGANKIEKIKFNEVMFCYTLPLGILTLCQSPVNICESALGGQLRERTQCKLSWSSPVSLALSQN